MYIDLFPFIVDSPSQVIPSTVTFTLAGVTGSGGYGRIGRGIRATIVILSPAIPPVSPATANYGFTA